MTEINDAKLKSFVDSIMAESRHESEGILADLKRRRDKDLAVIRRELDAEVSEYYERRSLEIKARESTRVSARAAENKRQLLQFREDCAKNVFSEVQKKIEAFTHSSDYPEHLGKLLRKAVEQLGYGFAADVHLRREDMQYSDYLLTQVSGVSLAFREGTFTMGGLRLTCPARGRRIDLSFDSAMSDLVGHFSELTGMQVEE